MELFNQGLTLMSYGISTVFVFLCLLIVAMTLMSAILKKLPEAPQDVDNKAVNTAQINPINTATDTTILPVLQAAITAHRNRKSV